MERSDVNRAVKQHLEMDTFFAGGFRVKGVSESEPVADPETVAGLEQLAQQVRQCCQCGLNESRTNAVPGEGNPAARLVFVGEAPGADEDAQGRPFVGKAGKFLDKIINAMGMHRGDVFICNILKCRPPGNRDPLAEEIVKCTPFLHHQLDLIQPEIIVALGAHAAKTLLNTDLAIGKLRGRFHEYYTSEGAEAIKLMPTYHPSYLLRSYSPDNRRRVWDDMKKVMAELGIDPPESSK